MAKKTAIMEVVKSFGRFGMRNLPIPSEKDILEDDARAILQLLQMGFWTSFPVTIILNFGVFYVRPVEYVTTE